MHRILPTLNKQHGLISYFSGSSSWFTSSTYKRTSNTLQDGERYHDGTIPRKHPRPNPHTEAKNSPCCTWHQDCSCRKIPTALRHSDDIDSISSLCVSRLWKERMNFSSSFLHSYFNLWAVLLGPYMDFPCPFHFSIKARFYLSRKSWGLRSLLRFLG